MTEVDKRQKDKSEENNSGLEELVSRTYSAGHCVRESSCRRICSVHLESQRLKSSASIDVSMPNTSAKAER